LITTTGMTALLALQIKYVF